MTYVYVTNGGDEQLVRITDDDGSILQSKWGHEWNFELGRRYIYIVKTVVASYPSRVDNDGLTWVRCDFETIKCVIHMVARKCKRKQVPMLFMRQWVRRGIIALGCVHIHSRRLPRDLLREIAGWAYVDETRTLVDIFMPGCLYSVRGLYICILLDGVRGPRKRVSGIHSHPITRDWHQYLCIEDVGVLTYEFRSQCPDHPARHFCGSLPDTTLRAMSFNIPDADGRPRRFIVQFEAAEMIEFTHRD